jgi:hypothetical protein
MTTLMPTLTVLRPRGQRPEVFRDEVIDQLRACAYCQYGHATKKVMVYSYKETHDHVLKVYGHKVRMDCDGDWNPDAADDGMEVAHFRPHQWDSVRSGRAASGGRR